MKLGRPAFFTCTAGLETSAVMYITMSFKGLTINSSGFRVIVTFGLNALAGRQKTSDGLWNGPWDSSNARDFVQYTVLKGYNVDSWEFGMYVPELNVQI